MTIIAVSRSLLMMAADSAMTVEGRKHRSDPKLYRFKDSIVGCAGDGNQIVRYLQWLKDGGERPKLNEMQSITLYRDGRIRWFSGTEMEILEDHFAVGTGAPHAIASMDTQAALGLPVDPRIAVQIACHRDPHCAEPITSLRWKQR